MYLTTLAGGGRQEQQRRHELEILSSESHNLIFMVSQKFGVSGLLNHCPFWNTINLGGEIFATDNYRVAFWRYLDENPKQSKIILQSLISSVGRKLPFNTLVRVRGPKISRTWLKSNHCSTRIYRFWQAHQ